MLQAIGVVVSPLKSLIQNQLNACDRIGIKAVTLKPIEELSANKIPGIIYFTQLGSFITLFHM